MPSIAEMLSDLTRDADDEPKLSHVGQVARLRGFLGRYQTPCPFQVGDLVTPGQDSPAKRKGEPHIVIEVLQAPRFHFDGESTSNTFGRRLTMRVAAMARGTTACWWVEHEDYQPFTGQGSREGDLPA